MGVRVEDLPLALMSETWPEPRLVETADYLPITRDVCGKMRGYWAWLIAGRMAFSAFEVDGRADKAQFKERCEEARVRLIRYVHAKLAPDPEPTVGEGCVAENGVLPLPPKKDEEV